MESILLDYDEKSVITAFDQTADQKQVFEGVEVGAVPFYDSTVFTKYIYSSPGTNAALLTFIYRPAPRPDPLAHIFTCVCSFPT